MDTRRYKLTYPQGSIYIYNLIPCELFLSVRAVFCAGKKSYFCFQMESSDKEPACLYTFCPAHSKAGRTASCRCAAPAVDKMLGGKEAHLRGPALQMLPDTLLAASAVTMQ